MYTITTIKEIVSATCINNVLVLHDELQPTASGNNEDRHFKNIHALFLNRIERLAHKTHGLSNYEENELQFMFEALMEAKRSQVSK